MPAPPRGRGTRVREVVDAANGAARSASSRCWGPRRSRPTPAFPPGFDAAGFVRHAKQQFIALQAAHDAGDRAALADVLTPEMYAEVVRDLDGGPRPADRSRRPRGRSARSETEGDRHWASVRFTGTLREGGGVPAPFDEVWNLSKPVDG